MNMKIYKLVKSSARHQLIAFLFFLVFNLFIPVTVVGQGLSLSNNSKNTPIEILADEGIEWQKEKELLVATGNAKASRDGVTVEAEIIRAFYRKKTKGGADLYRIDAAGGVKVYSSKESIVGQTAILNLDKAIFLIKGTQVKYSSMDGKITADRQMEYWERQNMAIARGNAVATQRGKTIKADVLKARFIKNNKGEQKVDIIEAFDNVFIINGKDRLRADRGIYRVRLGKAKLTRNVTIVRGENVLRGDQAEVNLNTGVSKLLTLNNINSKKTKRVRGLIFPKTQ